MSETITLEQLLTEVNVPPHMISLWTKKFPIFSPQRNPDGKITFKKRDIFFAKGLSHLLINQKESIKNVQTLLNEKGFPYIVDIGKHPESYKNHNAFGSATASGINFSATSFSKSTPSVTSSHKDIAKKAVSSLNHIFSEGKKENPVISPVINPVINSVAETAIASQIPLAPINTDNSAQTVLSDRNFEENWRTLMEKNGKAVPIEQVRDKPNLIDDDLLTDIWLIDDEINLFEEEEMIDIHQLASVNPLKKNHAHKLERLPVPPPVHTASIQYLKPAPLGLTIEQTEKIKHLVAKLDIMRDEMISANSVITKTLKAFGYSSFENAYNKFDQKSAY